MATLGIEAARAERMRLLSQLVTASEATSHVMNSPLVEAGDACFLGHFRDALDRLAQEHLERL